MSELSKSSPEKYIWVIERLNKRSSGNPVRIAPRSALSFLSLEEAVNSYPDTGESGDAYDVEATVDR